MALKPAIVKRIERANAQHGRHGPCFICGKPFDNCPHDTGQIETLLQLYRQKLLLREVGI